MVQYRLHVDKMSPDNRLSRYSKTKCLSNRLFSLFDGKNEGLTPVCVFLKHADNYTTRLHAGKRT